jgi:hypothetical protein
MPRHSRALLNQTQRCNRLWGGLTSETLRAKNEDFARNSEFPRLIRVFHQEFFFRFLDDSIQIPLEVDEDHQEM